MTSSVEPRPPRQISLANILENAPNASEDQLLLTLLLEFLRCMEANSVKVARSRGEQPSWLPPKAVPADVTEVSHICKKIDTILAKMEKDHWFKIFHGVFIDIGYNWGNLQQCNLWVEAVMQIVLEMPGFLYRDRLSKGPDIEDKHDLLPSVDEYQGKGDIEELLFKDVFTNWLYQRELNRVMANATEYQLNNRIKWRKG